MANIINQLEISGITYDIQDNDAQNTLLTKQDALVSGVNIKTINNESLLGSGNIVIEGGTGDAYTKAETDALLAAKADTSTVTSAVTEFSAALGNEITRAQGVEQVLSGAIDTKVDSNDVYLKSSTSSSTEINNALQAKADASTTYSKTEVDNAINAATSGKADTSTVTSAVSEFTTALSGEIQRAMAAEQALSGAISSNTGAYAFDFYGVKDESVTLNDALWNEMVAAYEAGKPFITTTDTMDSIYPIYAEYEEDHFFLEIIWNGGYEGLHLYRVEEGGEYTNSVVSEEEWIDLDGKADTSAVTAAINAATSGKADTTAVTAAINAAVSGKADTSAVTSAVTEFTAALSGEIQRAQGVEQVLSGAIDGKQATLVSGTNIKTINNQSLLGSGNIDIQGGSGANVVELTQAQYDALATKDPDTFYIITDATPIDTSSFYTTAQTSSSTQIATALSEKQNVLTAGTGIDITDNVISVTGGGGGGGKAVSAGTNISITTGDTADTINCTLPISSDTRNNLSLFYDFKSLYSTNYQNITIGTQNTFNSNGSIAHGDWNNISGNGAFVNGHTCTVSALRGVALGYKLTVNVGNAFACGQYNNSVSASTESGNTILSVGNGTADSTKHNALEIRQNGDIYYADTNNTTYQNYHEKPMIKLQDKFDEIDTIIGDINTILSSL